MYHPPTTVSRNCAHFPKKCSSKSVAICHFSCILIIEKCTTYRFRQRAQMEEQAASSQARELVFPAQLELRSTKRLRQKNQLAPSSFQQKLSFALHPRVLNYVPKAKRTRQRHATKFLACQMECAPRRALSSPLSSRARRSLPLQRQSTPSARRRPATRRLRRGSRCR